MAAAFSPLFLFFPLSSLPPLALAFFFPLCFPSLCGVPGLWLLCSFFYPPGLCFLMFSLHHGVFPFIILFVCLFLLLLFFFPPLFTLQSPPSPSSIPSPTLSTLTIDLALRFVPCCTCVSCLQSQSFAFTSLTSLTVDTTVLSRYASKVLLFFFGFSLLH